MEATEKTELLKGLVAESRKLSSSRVRDKIPQAERELITSKLVELAEPLLKQTKDRSALTIPDARRVLHELLDVSV